MKILITGGAGYIGSHTAWLLDELGIDYSILDDLSTGHNWSLKDPNKLYKIDLLDKSKLRDFFEHNSFNSIIHFAAKSLVGESNENPVKYYNNNVIGTINLLNEMVKNNIYSIVYSSSAAIFGNPVTRYINELHPKNPINVYGKTKYIVEEIIKDYSKCYGINYASLRYFNAAGAHKSSLIGEHHIPETHLIPNILNAIRNNSVFEVYGNDYDTDDGTCIRDYIHVTDLARAHVLALKYINETKNSSYFNLGNGKGFSVLDIIKSCERVTKSKLNFKFSARRSGDPDILVADSSLAKEVISWEPKYIHIDDIIDSAWQWHKKQT